MHVRFRSLGVLVCLAALAPAPAVRAQDKSTPTVMVRVKALDGILGDAKFLAKEIGKENEASQFEQLIQSQIGPKGLFGIDTKRPLGLYGKVAGEIQNSTAVVLVPIADQDTLLKQLETFGIQPTKEKDGTYSLNLPGVPVPVFFRFTNQYLYATALSKDAISGDKVMAPAQLFPQGDKALVSLVINMDQIPDNLKQMALQQAEELSRKQDEKRPGETEDQRKARLMGQNAVMKLAAMIYKEGGRQETALTIDQQTKQLTLDSTFAAKSGTQLATDITALGRSQSIFGGLTSATDAISVLFHGTLPEGVRKEFASAIENGIRKDLEKEKDAAKRALGEKVLKAALPSLNAGELDLLVRAAGPTQGTQYGFVAGIKVRDSAAVKDALRSAMDALPAPEKALVKMDAEKAGDVSINRVDAQSKYDADAKKVFGDNPLFFTVTSQAVLFAGGPNGLELIKTATAAPAKQAPQLAATVSLRRLAPLIASDPKNKAALGVAEDVFGKAGKDSDKVELTVRGGSALKTRLVVPTAVLRFAAEVGEKSKK